jgi:hypothetical protein
VHHGASRFDSIRFDQARAKAEHYRPLLSSSSAIVIFLGHFLPVDTGSFLHMPPMQVQPGPESLLPKSLAPMCWQAHASARSLLCKRPLQLPAWKISLLSETVSLQVGAVHSMVTTY